MHKPLFFKFHGFPYCRMVLTYKCGVPSIPRLANIIGSRVSIHGCIPNIPESWWKSRWNPEGENLETSVIKESLQTFLYWSLNFHFRYSSAWEFHWHNRCQNIPIDHHSHQEQFVSNAQILQKPHWLVKMQEHQFGHKKVWILHPHCIWKQNKFFKKSYVCLCLWTMI